MGCEAGDRNSGAVHVSSVFKARKLDEVIREVSVGGRGFRD